MVDQLMNIKFLVMFLNVGLWLRLDLFTRVFRLLEPHCDGTAFHGVPVDDPITLDLEDNETI